MAPAPLTRRQMLALLGAGFFVSCSPRRGPGEAQSEEAVSSSTTAPPATTTTTAAPPLLSAPPPFGGEPPFDRVNPMSGFIAFGDSGGGADQAAVAEAMLRWTDDHRVDALVTTGDNVYDFGEPHLFEAQLITPYRALREGGRPLWAVLGNHDVMRGHGAEQLAFLGLPPLPFEQRLPGVRILFLDGNRPGDAAQKQWLADSLAEPAPPLFTVAVFHQPVFSCGIHGRTQTVIEAWYDLLDSGRVSLVLTGHDHQYQRFLTAEGTTFIVTGGGGRNLYRLIPGCSAPEMRAGVVKHHFTGIEIYSDRLALTAVTPDGTIIDQIEIPAALIP